MFDRSKEVVVSKIIKLGRGVYFNKETSRISYDDKELKLVVLIFNLRELNVSYREIAEHLGINSSDIVRNILRNELYKTYYRGVVKKHEIVKERTK